MKKISKKVISTLVIAIMILSTGMLSMPKNLPTIQLSASQLDFLDTITQAYEMNGMTASVSDYNSQYAVLNVVTKNGVTKKHLFDLNTEKVVSSNYKGKLNNTKRNVLFASSSNSDDNSDEYYYNELGKLVKIKRPTMTYDFIFDADGNETGKVVDGITVFNRTYSNGKVVKETYKNGAAYSSEYDSDGNLVRKVLAGEIIAEYEYQDSKMVQENDIANGIVYTYEYSADGKLHQIITNNGYKITYTYGEEDNIESKTFILDKFTIENKFDGSGITSNIFETINDVDIAERIKTKTINVGNFDYVSNFDYKVWQPTSMDLTMDNYEYYYDNVTTDTNITKLVNNYYTFDYIYDNADRVIQSTDGTNVYKYSYDERNELMSYTINDQTVNITYDMFGNILTKNGNQYEYNKDTLIRYNGTALYYDEIGNPISYCGNNLSWTGRLLKTYNNYEYNYDKNGVRINKNIDGVITQYFTEGSKVMFEKTGDKTIAYLYDGNDVIGFIYDSQEYYYIKDGQSNVVGIFNQAGEQVASYLYDPFGKILLMDGEMAEINPYRYRSYRYDTETGLYYLNARYYDPEIGRFLSPDDINNLSQLVLSDTFTKNLYIYAMNNPVSYYDPNGKMAVALLNAMKSVYADFRVLPDSAVGSVTTVLNSGNLYNGFHETAQLVAAKRLSMNGYSTTLEYKCSAGEIDVFASKAGLNYVYEVKPYGTSSTSHANQINSYVAATGALRGPSFSTYSVQFLPMIKMYVSCSGNGQVIYTFYKEYKIKVLFVNVQVKNLLTEQKLVKGINTALWAGVAVAGAIVAVGLAASLPSFGTSNAPAMATAAVAFCAIMTIPMLLL